MYIIIFNYGNIGRELYVTVLTRSYTYKIYSALPLKCTLYGIYIHLLSIIQHNKEKTYLHEEKD